MHKEQLFTEETEQFYEYLTAWPTLTKQNAHSSLPFMKVTSGLSQSYKSYILYLYTREMKVCKLR